MDVQDMDKIIQRLEEAVRLGECERVESILQQLPNTAEVINARRKCCCVALSKRALPLVQILYCDKLVSYFDRHDVIAIMELLSSAIEADFVDGMKFLQFRHLCKEIFNGGCVSYLYKAAREGQFGIWEYLASTEVADFVTLLSPLGEFQSIATFKCVLKRPIIRQMINYRSRKTRMAALHMWIKNMSCEITCLPFVIALVEAGSDVHMVCNDFKTPLFLSAEKGFLSVMGYLLDRGAACNLVDLYLNNVLHAIVPLPYSDIFIEKLIKVGVEVNLLNIYGYNPLQIAIQNERVNIVKMLLETNCHMVNETDSEGNTPLLLSLHKKNFPMIRTLLQHGADANIPYHNGETPLWKALRENDLPDDIVFDLISKSEDCVVNNVDCEGNTPLLLAVRNKNLPIVKNLLSRTDVNRPDNQGTTPLCEAIKRGDTRIVMALLGVDGCDVIMVDKTGRTPLMLAMSSNNTDIVDIILTHIIKLIMGESILIKCRNLDILRPFINEETHLPSNDYQNRVLKLILKMGDKGSFDNVRSIEVFFCKNGENILHLMARVFDLPLVPLDKLMSDTRVDINHTNDYGESPLMVAAMLHNCRYIEALLRQKHCNVNLQNTRGHTGLYMVMIGFVLAINMYMDPHIVVFRRCLNVFLKAQVDVDLRDDNGETVLMLAAKYRDMYLLKRLLELSTNVKLVSNDSRSVTQYMSFHTFFDSDFCKMLTRYGCINAVDESERTMVQCAITNRWLDEDYDAVLYYLLASNCSLKNLATNVMDVDVYGCWEMDDMKRKMLYESGAYAEDVKLVLPFSQDEANNGQETGEKVYNVFCFNVSLKSKCRRVIRQHLVSGAQVTQAVTQLGLPKMVQDFLLLKDELSEEAMELESRVDCCDEEDEYDDFDFDLEDFTRYHDQYEYYQAPFFPFDSDTDED